MNRTNGQRPHILIAGMGNVLRGDDGFGVEAARRLKDTADLPPSVTVVDVGIGGIHLVHELLAPRKYDALVVVDTVQHDGPPGKIYMLEAEVADLDELSELARRDFLADMHYTIPSRALILAKALGVLPQKTFIVGCKPDVDDDFEIGLSQPVADAVEEAVVRVTALVNELVEKAK